MELKKRDYRMWIKSAEQYYAMAAPNAPRPVLTDNMQYNLLSLSLECYMLAILDFHHVTPLQQRFPSLMDALETLMVLPADLRRTILKHERMRTIGGTNDRMASGNNGIDDLNRAVTTTKELALNTCYNEQLAI